MKIEDVQAALSQKKPLFTALIYGLKPVKKNEIPTLATDGNCLYYNEQFFNSLSLSEQMGVILHETLHCALRHLWTRKAFDPMRWNMAADYVVNITVTEDFQLPKGTLLDHKYINMTTKQVYYALPKDKKMHQGWGKNDCNYGADSKPKQGQSTVFASGDKNAISRPSAAVEEVTAQKWKQLFEDHIVKQYGKMPGSLQRQVEENYYVPTINWKELVERFLSADQTDYTFAQPDRRYLEGDFVMPDLYSQDTLKDVVFAYDTSGSISPEDLRGFLGETKSLMKQFFTLKGWGAVCDWNLHWFEPLTAEDAENIRYMGGGGTSFRPVFDKIKELHIRPKALFYFTDTYGDFPDEAPEYPVFWLVPTKIGGEDSLHVPFGYLVQFLLNS